MVQKKVTTWSCYLFLKIFKLIFREGKGGRKRGRETSMCGYLSSGPYWGPGPQPRHVPWLGIEPLPFGSQSSAQSTEPHQPGLFVCFFLRTYTCTVSAPQKKECHEGCRRNVSSTVSLGINWFSPKLGSSAIWWTALNVPSLSLNEPMSMTLL